MSEYFVLQVSNLTHQGEEWLSENAFTFGALGVSEVLGFDQPEGEETVFTKVADRHTVEVYFQEAPPREFTDALLARFPTARVHVNSEQEKDWLAEWKKGFKPFPLTGPHWVVPSWHQPPPEAKHPIWIDPGMAFGTGTHETTQLVAEELGLLRPQGSLLDVGTGTGILAILAYQMGVKDIQATELEPEARRVARENFARNGCAHIRLDQTQIEDLTARYDTVVANIIDGVLVRIQDDLKARVAPGGRLILSGIITEREPDFLSGFKLPADRTWDVRRQKGDWLLYAVRL